MIERGLPSIAFLASLLKSWEVGIEDHHLPPDREMKCLKCWESGLASYSKQGVLASFPHVEL